VDVKKFCSTNRELLPNHDSAGCILGPCGGKTTGQARLCTFFESIGWKVCYDSTLCCCIL